jgi:hypothetical protein
VSWFLSAGVISAEMEEARRVLAGGLLSSGEGATASRTTVGARRFDVATTHLEAVAEIRAVLHGRSL